MTGMMLSSFMPMDAECGAMTLTTATAGTMAGAAMAGLDAVACGLACQKCLVEAGVPWGAAYQKCIKECYDACEGIMPEDQWAMSKLNMHI